MSSWPWQPEELAVDSSVPPGLLVVGAGSEGELELTVYPWPQVDEAGRIATDDTPVVSVKATDKEVRAGIATSMSFGRSANALGFPELVAGSLEDGDVYALSGDSKSSVTEAANGDLSWLSPPPQRLKDALERARDATFAPYAWAIWENWRGDPELIAQIARAGEWAMEDLGLGRHETRIAIHVDGDRERFDAPWRVATELTQQAARRFDAATIEQSCVGGLEIGVSIARGELLGREWVDNAVLLEVRAKEAGRFADTVAVRDRVATAIERGKKRFGESLHGEGMAEHDDSGGEARLTGAPRERLEGRTGRLAFLGGAYALLVVFAFWTYPSDWPAAERIWAIAFTFLGVFIGIVIGVDWFLSGVELGKSTRMLRLSSGAKAAAIALLGAAVPVLVRWALAEFLGIKAG